MHILLRIYLKKGPLLVRITAKWLINHLTVKRDHSLSSLYVNASFCLCYL